MSSFENGFDGTNVAVSFFDSKKKSILIQSYINKILSLRCFDLAPAVVVVADEVDFAFFAPTTAADVVVVAVVVVADVVDVFEPALLLLSVVAGDVATTTGVVAVVVVVEEVLLFTDDNETIRTFLKPLQTNKNIEKSFQILSYQNILSPFSWCYICINNWC